MDIENGTPISELNVPQLQQFCKQLEQASYLNIFILQ